MTSLEQAARQALDALIWTTGSTDFGKFGHAHQGALKLLFPAIEALRQAIEPKPCDMGQICLDCQPRGANGECPDQQPKQEPPRGEWVGLTDEEIENLCWTEMDRRLLSFARAIEAKLKQLNQRNGSANGCSHECT